MELFTAIEQRRAVKHFHSGEQMSERDFQKMMEAVLLSPTSYNIQHWRFVRVSNAEVREQVGEAAWGQPQVTEASELLVLCADTQAWAKQPERYWQNVDAKAQGVLVDMLASFYHGKDQLQRDEAMRSCGMAAQTLMLAAKGLGYDTCPMIGFDAGQLAEVINLPQDHVIGMIIAIGKAAKPAGVRGGQLAMHQVLMQNYFV
ncbi:nitroreductase family protein [Agarivorans albus]|uniref:Oxygen-insensitive NAD(P)H nitroreductase n=1 Tax=Agarivorans albus MKT 106 TaxID=1331007 RepID=R9PHS4_AGAAL|nr:nitroreductase family protein [Agarivorans albus]GAD00867.1 oxygen-insensitive NAD(P)H nitroreductase [Agarivorans albus MKT 106]